MANILTAEQLIEERQKATKKQLPSFGSKDFLVTGSEDEKEKISNILSTTKSLLAGERVEKSNLLSNAEWDKELRLAKVTKKVGKFFETFGHSVNGNDYLYPEEALFLLENSNLELFFCGLSVSIQRGYSLLLSIDSGCNLNEFRVYSYLSKNGYRVFRHEVTTVGQNCGKQISFSKAVCDKVAVPTEQSSAPKNSSTEVSKKQVAVSEANSISRTKIVEPSSENTEVSCRENVDTCKTGSNEIVTGKSDQNETATPAKNTEPLPASKAQAWLKVCSENNLAEKQCFPLSKKVKKLMRKSLLGRIYPTENESFLPSYDPVKTWTSPKKIRKEIKSVTKPRALSHDVEFTRITKNFPTFENGQFTTSMPADHLPLKISSKYASTTMNVETGQITHDSRRDSVSPEVPLSQKRVVPVPNKRYFSKKARKRLAAAKQRPKVFKSGNFSRPRRRREQNNLVNSMQKILNVSEAHPSSTNQFAQQPTNEAPSGPPNLANTEVAVPSPWAPSPLVQTPFNQQIQVKAEFMQSANQQVMNVNQMNQPFMNQPFTNEQTPFNNPANPLNPNVLGQVIANVVSQLIPNQLNQNFPDQSNPNFPNQVNLNFPNQMNPNFPNQPNPNFPTQMNPSFPNQMNPNFPNQMNPNFPNQMNPNFPNQMNPNFQNPMNPNFPSQMNTNFPTSGNPSFFNPPAQNFGPRYPSQRFQRPFNNYGNNNNNVSEVTRHARKMQGMARRMLAVAQAMFKNPEEFSENPENINIYNFSNRFRNPNDQRPWRHPNQMQNSNNNYRNNYRPRFENNFNTFNSNFGRNSSNPNFGQNSFNSNFGPSFNPDRNAFDNSNTQNQDNNSYQAADRNDSFGSRNDENNPNHITNSNDSPEKKFNPNARTTSADGVNSDPSPPGDRDNIFFVDVVGENPSNLLKKARTIPGSQPTISFADQKPASSSSSESSESESDNDDIEVIEPSKKKPNIEMIDVLSSDEEIFMSISSNVKHSKQKADTLCSKLGKNLKTKNPEVIDIDGASKKRRLDSDAEVITLDDDVTVIDDEPALPVDRIDNVTQDSSENSSSSENVASSKDSSTSEPSVAVKQEIDGDTRIKTENSTGDSECMDGVLRIKKEANTAIDNCERRIETTSENSFVPTPVKRETCDDQSREETGNESQDANVVVSCFEQNVIETPADIRIKSEGEVESTDKSVEEASESGSSESDEESENDISSNAVPADGVVLENDAVNIEKPSLSEDMTGTSSSTVEKPAVIEIDSQSKRTPCSDAGTASEGGWAALKSVEKEALPKVSDNINKETAQQGNVDERTVVEVGDSITNKDTETNTSRVSDTLSEENKPQALLQPHHCKNLGTVLNALQIFKPTTNEPKDLVSLKVSFDVYQPKKVFGKASRPDPDFRIIVTGYLDPVPSPVQIDEIKNRYSDNIKILFAVVHPSSISFFFIGNVQVPVQIDDLLF